MDNRRKANILKGVFKYFKKFLILFSVLFSIITVYNKEFKFLFRQTEISFSDAYEYGYGSIHGDESTEGKYGITFNKYSESQQKQLRWYIQRDIISSNSLYSLIISAMIYVVFFTGKGIYALIKFTKKYSD